MKETHSDIANKIEDQNGAAELKDNKIFLSDITKTIDTFNLRKIFCFYGYGISCRIEWIANI